MYGATTVELKSSPREVSLKPNDGQLAVTPSDIRFSRRLCVLQMILAASICFGTSRLFERMDWLIPLDISSYPVEPMVKASNSVSKLPDAFQTDKHGLLRYSTCALAAGHR